jgi:hypothetical protein
MTPVLYVVKPPVETVSSRHHRLSIDSQKSEDIIIIIIIYLLQLGLHPVAVVLTLHNYNKIHTIKTSTLLRNTIHT